MGNLFKSPPKPVIQAAPPIPEPPPVTPLADPEDELAKARKRKQAAASRTGFLSTILSDRGSGGGGETLGA